MRPHCASHQSYDLVGWTERVSNARTKHVGPGMTLGRGHSSVASTQLRAHLDDSLAGHDGNDRSHLGRLQERYFTGIADGHLRSADVTALTVRFTCPPRLTPFQPIGRTNATGGPRVGKGRHIWSRPFTKKLDRNTSAQSLLSVQDDTLNDGDLLGRHRQTIGGSRTNRRSAVLGSSRYRPVAAWIIIATGCMLSSTAAGFGGRASGVAFGADSSSADVGRALLKRARDSAALARDKSMHVAMTTAGGGGPELHRSLTGFEKLTPEGRKILWVFDSPADLAGTRFLAWRQPEGRELLWVFFPAQRRVRQVTDQMRRERFQGSDFTYDDFASIVYFDYDGAHTLLREEPCGAATCAVVETELVPGRFASRRLRTWLRTDVPLPHRIEFFGDEDGSEEMVKQVDVLDTTTIEGIPTVVAMEAHHVRSDSRTDVRFSDVRYNTGLSDEAFSLASLSTAR